MTSSRSSATNLSIVTFRQTLFTTPCHGTARRSDTAWTVSGLLTIALQSRHLYDDGNGVHFPQVSWLRVSGHRA